MRAIRALGRPARARIVASREVTVEAAAVAVQELRSRALMAESRANREGSPRSWASTSPNASSSRRVQKRDHLKKKNAEGGNNRTRE